MPRLDILAQSDGSDQRPRPAAAALLTNPALLVRTATRESLQGAMLRALQLLDRGSTAMECVCRKRPAAQQY